MTLFYKNVPIKYNIIYYTNKYIYHYLIIGESYNMFIVFIPVHILTYDNATFKLTTYFIFL